VVQGGWLNRTKRSTEALSATPKIQKKVHCEIISISKQQQAEATIKTTEEFDRLVIHRSIGNAWLAKSGIALLYT